MRWRMGIAAAAAAVGIYSAAQAQGIQSLFAPLGQQPPEMPLRDDPGRRRLVLPSIRAATDCVAREALNENGMPEAYSRGELATNLGNPIRRCAGQLRFMITEHDRIYGYGAGKQFYDGPYIEDLPRAVVKRIGPQLDRVMADLQRRDAERQVELQHAQDVRRAELAQQDADRKTESDRQAAARKVEAEQRDADRKLALERTESQRRAEQLKGEELKRQQLDAASGANRILRDRVLECVGHEMQDLVKSGESAEILATATMTICSAQVDKLLEGLIDAQKIETGAVYVGEGEKSALRNSGRAGIREQVLTVAVRAKASAAKSSSSSF